MLTISAVSAFCVNIKGKFLKKITYSNPFLNLLPSVYESEVISIKFLYFTAFFLTLSFNLENCVVWLLCCLDEMIYPITI